MAYKYMIVDKQVGGYGFGGAIFTSKEQIREQLISYHSIDCEENDFGYSPIEDYSLREILDYGQWEIERQ